MKAKLFRGSVAALCLLGGVATASAQTADLEITKVNSQPTVPVAPGGTAPAVFTITVTNHGPDDAVAVSVTDFTDSGALQFSENAGDCTGAFPCSLGTIPSGESRVITSSFTLPSTYTPPNPVFNYANVSSSTFDNDNSNNFAYAASLVTGINCGDLEVSAGGVHTCARVAGNGKAPPNNLDDDHIECWGNDTDQISSGAPAGPFKQVSAGYIHTCAVSTTGSLSCWGDNSYTQLDNIPSGTNFVQVASGYNHTCALRDDGSVLCWGTDYVGETVPAAGVFQQIASGYVHSCGLRTNGTVACWGNDDLNHRLVSDAPTDNDFVQVDAANEYACALHSNGQTECWGFAYESETNPSNDAFTKITLGERHGCGLKADKSVKCWGNNDSGQKDVPNETFDAIDAGAYHSCGILGDGDILCWGDNYSLQSTPPERSFKCPVCGDGVIEAPAESCESSAPNSNDFPVCCSPVTCRSYRLSENRVCRAAVGGCDAPEVCDGTSFSTCPAPGGRRPAGYVCRAALGGCDPVETCDGSSDFCPSDSQIAAAGTVCRAAAGSCDVVETCNGVTSVCPANVLVSAGTVCRATQGVCDVQETCSGSSALCPADSFVSSSTVCRTAGGICDLAENCSGSAAACPDDAVRNGSFTCRPSSGVCDMTEVCDGLNKACPADGKVPNTITCRDLAGPCDAVEYCTGNGDDCPSDAKATAGTVCRGAVSNCDVDETCTGASDECPADAVAASTVVCRAAGSACDVAENCSGLSTECPVDAFQPTTVACNDAQYCNGADHCDGNGSCGQHAGDPCTASGDGDGNCSESCNELADNCTAPDPNGSSCNDANACTTGETCQAGACGAGETVTCDDGDLCTTDTCDTEDGCQYAGEELPVSSCYVAARSTLQIRRDTGDPSKNALKWTWRKGEPVDTDDLGDPSADVEYSLCLFDHTGGVARLAGSYGMPAGSSLWRVKSYQLGYSDKESLVAGFKQIKAKADGRPEKSGASASLAGVNLDLPALYSPSEFFDMDSSVTVQLRNSKGACWTSDFTPTVTDRNDAGGVKSDTQ